MKLLSVIIPLYNSALWLPKCLESVLNQDVSKEEMEIICINDGSPDDSEDIAKRYQLEYPDSIVVLTQENQGPSGARNNGIKHASGKYLCFVDPDDFVEPNVFGGLLKQMDDEQLDMLRFDYRIVDEEYKPINKRSFERQFDYSPSMMKGAEFLANRLDIACNIWRYFYRTELIVKNHIWCFTGDYFDDTPWLPLVLLNAERMNICDTVVYVYQERGDSLVKANSLAVVKRKNEGYLLLIRLMKEELKGLKGEEVGYSNMKMLNSIHLDPAVEKDVMAWYEMMITHGAISLMSSVACYVPESSRAVVNELRKMKVFPLSIRRISSAKRRKIVLYSVFPLLMMKLSGLKSKSN